jgi:putative tryptophan/tyrosine transport system substrate-binding protein
VRTWRSTIAGPIPNRSTASSAAAAWPLAARAQRPALAAELARRQVSLIYATTNLATFATKEATTTIPIVFVVNEDPVGLGLVASLARPGGNATGINILTAELTAKRLDLLRELVPGAARVGLLVNPANATSTESTLRDMAEAARATGLQIKVFNASTSPEIEAAFAGLARDRPEVLSSKDERGKAAPPTFDRPC